MSYQAPQPVHPTPRRGVPLIIGLVIGLVVGAGVVGVVWTLNTPSDSNAKADAEAVCGVIARTPAPSSAEAMKDMAPEDYRRWGVAEVGPSLAKAEAELKPLAEAMQDILPAVQRFDFEQAKTAVDRVKQLCGEL